MSDTFQDVREALNCERCRNSGVDPRLLDDALGDVLCSVCGDGQAQAPLSWGRVRSVLTAYDAAQLRLRDYDTRLSEVMPSDYKDWHQNNPAEWPMLAALTITDLRERAETAERVQRERDREREKWAKLRCEVHDMQFQSVTNAAEFMALLDCLDKETTNARSQCGEPAMPVIKCRKKPIVLGAVQWTGDNLPELQAWCPDLIVDWPGPHIYIQALEGLERVERNAYVLKGTRGEYWPVRQDIFEETYDVVEDQR